MLRTWVPWALTGVLLVAAAFVAGLVIAGGTGGPRASVTLPESENGLAAEVERLRAARDDQAAARERATALAAEVESLKGERADLRAKLARATERAESAEAARADLAERLGTLQDRVGALQDRIGALQDRLAATRERARTAAEAADAARVAEPRVSESACRALAAALPAEESLPSKTPGAAAFAAIDPDTDQTKTLAEGVLAYECTDYRGAYRRWLPLAQAGFPRAQFHVGALFYEGRGVDRDLVLAFAWLTLAARHDISAAEPLLEEVGETLDDKAIARAQEMLDRAG